MTLACTWCRPCCPVCSLRHRLACFYDNFDSGGIDGAGVRAHARTPARHASAGLRRRGLNAAVFLV